MSTPETQRAQAPILQEPDPSVLGARLAATHAFAKGLAELAAVLGIPLPERM